MDLEALKVMYPNHPFIPGLIAEIERLAEACEDSIPYVAVFMGMMDNPMDNPKAAENAKDCLRKINDALLSVKGTAPIREEFFQ